MVPMVVPPRPDLEGSPPALPAWYEAPSAHAPLPRRSRALGVVALGVAVMLLVAAVAPILTRTSRPSGAGYSFLAKDFSGHPYRWNPCAPIHYVTNVVEAPPGTLGDVREAVRRVSDATGIRFIEDGDASEIPTRDRAAFQPERYGQVWAPVLIAWVSPDETDIPFERNGHTAAGVASPLGSGEPGSDAFVSGWIAINTEDPNPVGFGWPGAQGPVVQHELGHVMGLGHVKENGELMQAAGGGVTDFGPGDLAGLRQLGRQAGCLATPAIP
jgi:hypothetical protein